ncbi:sigma-70 family RNA polymerase sigma factor [Actinopolymorpha rutila]|uniref:RNA polymerase sigma factor n=1 Tax=Actinopolymorpha rutila TaxID=446787 RepID=A0A852Z6E8_9ACTN|nr:RNA polymerase sigma-70 factor (ECF subfamily) [Actinopolymorpha rutila]
MTTSAPADDTLVARARIGDTTAFAQLVRRYSGPAYRIALRILGDADAAQDVAQEAFLTAWRRLDRIREEQAFAAWLYRIVTTAALQAARSRRAHPDAELDHEHVRLPPSATGNPEQHVLAAHLLTALQAALGLLTPEQRACWVLRELEGLSYDEIAEVAGIGPDAVRGRIHRARVRLARELKPWR